MNENSALQNWRFSSTLKTNNDKVNEVVKMMNSTTSDRAILFQAYFRGS